MSNDAQLLEKFVSTGNLALLGDKGVTFEKDEQFKTYLNFIGQCGNISSVCIMAAITPVAACCGGSMYDNFELGLTADSIVYKTAINDCCFHIATTQKTIPLDKVQDVQLNTNCCLSCFHLKSVDVQTAGQGSAMAEVTAAFCKNPEQAREAIRLAVKRAKEAGPAGAALMAAPGQQAMSAAAGAAAGGAGGGLRVRLSNLEYLTKHGGLSAADAAAVRVAVLAEAQDPTARLVEAVELCEQGLVTKEELFQLGRLFVAAHSGK